MGNDTTMWKIFQDHPNYIHSYSPGARSTDSLADPDLISDIVVWLASDASSLVTAAQIPADKGYLKISRRTPTARKFAESRAVRNVRRAARGATDA